MKYNIVNKVLIISGKRAVLINHKRKSKMLNKTLPILFVVFSLMILLSVNCTKDNSTGSEENANYEIEENTNCETVPVQVEFINGFANHQIMLHFNDQLYYSALLSESVLLSGPIAHFTTELPRTENSVFIFCRNLTPPLFNTYQDSTSIHLESAEKYYFELVLIDGLFSFTLQDKRY